MEDFGSGEKRRSMGERNSMEGESILRIFPEYLRRRFYICMEHYKNIQEIRLRAYAPVIFMISNKEYFLKQNGCISTEPGEDCYLNEHEIADILQHVCRYSVYAYEDEIRQGFITVPGGHRIGIAGQAVLEGRESIRYLKNIHYMNVRVAHERKGTADSVVPFLYKNGVFLNTLILSPPGCGKTTLLRDLIRQVSNGNTYGKGITVSVIDERSEIAGSFQGIAQNDLGIRTDIMDACPKLLGMMMVIRSMAPELLAVDELGSDEEVRLLRQADSCGCRILATIHAEDVDDLKRKRYMLEATKQELFQRFIVLNKRENQFNIEGIYDRGFERC